jgi:type I restriction enzyme R subunit
MNLIAGTAVAVREFRMRPIGKAVGALEGKPFGYASINVELQVDQYASGLRAGLNPLHRSLDAWVKRLHAEGGGMYTAADDTRRSSFRARIQTMPPLEPGSLYANQIEAVSILEHSLKRNRTRALVHVATGSGRTIAAITAIYRLIKYAGARRVRSWWTAQIWSNRPKGVPRVSST